MISILKCMTSMPCKVDDDYIYLHEDTHYLFVDIIHANSAIEHEFYVSSGPDNLEECQLHVKWKSPTSPHFSKIKVMSSRMDFTENLKFMLKCMTVY